MDKCEYCQLPDEGKCSGIFDFKKLCCRVRWVLGCPSREIAQAWLEFWKSNRNIGSDAVEETRIAANRVKNERKDTATAKTIDR